MPLIGEPAPEFHANTTNGPIHFPNDMAGKWVIFFAHPSDFTPVCTTEFIALQQASDEFAKINTELLGLSVGTISSHLGWFDAIRKLTNGLEIKFPVIDDASMNVAKMYGMVHPASSDISAVRAVFVIDPAGIIRTILFYPATLGRNTAELWRILVGLQTADAFKVAIPVNWVAGDDVLQAAPKTAAEIEHQPDSTTWFIKYKKLSKDDIYSKICKQKSDKK